MHIATALQLGKDVFVAICSAKERRKIELSDSFYELEKAVLARVHVTLKLTKKLVSTSLQPGRLSQEA